MSITTKVGTTTSGVGQTYTQPLANSLNWNIPLNNNFDIINKALGGTQSYTVGSSAITVTADEANNSLLILSGTLTANINLRLPDTAIGYTGLYFNITNLGSYYVNVITTAVGSNGPVINSNGYYVIFNDGQDVNFANSASSVPSGTISMYGGSSAPSGWLICDGNSYLISVYPELYAALVVSATRPWDNGPSLGYFNVPDLRGAFLRGSGVNGNTTAGSNGITGQSVGDYVSDTYLNHSHAITQTGHAHTVYAKAASNFNTGGGATALNDMTTPSGTGTIVTGTTSSDNANITVDTSTTGGTETAPQSFGINFIIKT
jgi:microcystin-dependent protein